MRIRASHKSTGQKMGGLLSALILPSGTKLLPNNRRVRTLSAYDSRARYLSGSRMGFLGDDPDPFAGITSSDLDSLSTGDLTIGPGDYVNTIPTSGPGSAYSSVIASGGGVDAANNAAYAALQSTITPDANPTDYVSPSAALAAGVPAATVNAAWATPQGVNSFPTAAAATSALTASLGAAGAAATVAKLWTGGGQTLPTSGASWLSQSSIVAGMANSSVLLWGVVGLVGFSLLSGKKRR